VLNFCMYSFYPCKHWST